MIFLKEIGFDKTNSDQEIVLTLPIKKNCFQEMEKNRKKTYRWTVRSITISLQKNYKHFKQVVFSWAVLENKF